MAEDMKIVKRGRRVREPVRVALPEPTDTERLDYLIRYALYATITCHLEGKATPVQLDRKYIDNAITRQRQYLVRNPGQVASSPRDEEPGNG